MGRQRSRQNTKPPRAERYLTKTRVIIGGIAALVAGMAIIHLSRTNPETPTPGELELTVRPPATSSVAANPETHPEELELTVRPPATSSVAANPETHPEELELTVRPPATSSVAEPKYNLGDLTSSDIVSRATVNPTSVRRRRLTPEERKRKSEALELRRVKEQYQLKLVKDRMEQERAGDATSHPPIDETRLTMMLQEHQQAEAEAAKHKRWSFFSTS